jgi:DNA polymerase-3 subunit gamma/tau
MVLVRLCHAADLPTPDEAIRMLAEAGNRASPPVREPARAPAPAAAPRQAHPNGHRGAQVPAVAALPHPAPEPPPFRSFDDVIARARSERDRLLLFELERHVRPVRFEPGQLEIALTPDAKPDLPQRLGQVLRAWTGSRWMVAVTQEGASETAHESRAKGKAALMEEVRADPLVKSVLDRFPGAEIVSVRERQAVELTVETSPSDED